MPRVLRPGDRWRGRAIVLLLGASLAVVGVLALQAHSAVQSHRASAEGVLRDYAGLAASELISRTASEVGFYGFYPLISAMRRELEAGRTPADRDALAGALGERNARAIQLVAATFDVDPTADGRVAHAGIPAATLQRMTSEDSAVGKDDSPPPYRVRHEAAGGRARSFVYDLMPAPSGTRRLVGFEVDQRRLGEWIARVAERAPLLPESLAPPETARRAVHVRVTDPAGHVVHRSGDIDARSGLVATKPFGDAYEGALRGYAVEAAIEASAADGLVIGGLPTSRLPVLAGLLLLGAGLLATALLQLQRERALAELRSDFVSRVSHELRTPLTQIRLFVETLILDRVRSAEERRRALEIIDREARRLTNLVDNALQFTRADRRRLELTPTDIDLSAQVRETVGDFSPIAAAASNRIDVEVPAACRVSADAAAVRQILLNLLDNAVKYGPAGQTVRVRLEEAGGLTSLSVEDEGPGVPPSERDRIFDDWHRLERDRSSPVAGTGIGLAMVRELAVRHAGRCRVEDAPGGGARFVVELPKGELGPGVSAAPHDARRPEVVRGA